MKKIVITQSNYIPWRGYFDLINYADEFIFFDEVQYTRRDWRNRNKVIFNDKIKWLTIPLKNKGNFSEKIYNMETINSSWKSHHLNIIESYYYKTSKFKILFKHFTKMYENCNEKKLSLINQYFILNICELFNIKTKFLSSIEIPNKNSQSASERLLDICLSRKAKIYITGSSAINYLNLEIFKNKKIDIQWFDYGKSKKYHQVGSSYFSENLSIVDCIFNCGLDKNKFLNY